jgi:hypothetical protein
MTADDEERAFLARWRMLQAEYRRLLQAWRRYPAPSDDDPTAEARDRGVQLGGGRA